MPSSDIRTALSIIFSACTYLFAYGSNIATLLGYYHRRGTVDSSGLKEDQGLVWTALAFICVGHTANALIFKLKLPKKDQPVRAAYFFPLIQFVRLIKVFRKTFDFKGFKDLESGEKGNLFNLLTLAFETGPFLVLQFSIFISNEKREHGIFLISVVASFLAVTYSGGMILLFASKNAVNAQRKVATFITGGTYTCSCLFLRGLTAVALTRWRANEDGWGEIGYWLGVHWVLFWSLSALEILTGCIFFWCVSSRQRSWKRLGDALCSAYISLWIGPLYSLITEHSPGPPRKMLLCLAEITHLFYHVVVFFLSLSGLHCRAYNSVFPCIYLPSAMSAVALRIMCSWVYVVLERARVTDEASNVDELQQTGSSQMKIVENKAKDSLH